MSSGEKLSLFWGFFFTGQVQHISKWEIDDLSLILQKKDTKFSFFMEHFDNVS
jgi:hypothetical protein